MKVSEIHDINLKKALERAEYALRESECVEGVLIFGSIARKQYDSYSDVDLMVMIGKESCPESLKVHVSREFSDSVMMEKDGKIILFPPGLPKVELYIFHSSEADEAKKLFLGSKITDPHDTIMFDRNGDMTRMVGEWKDAGEEDVKNKAAGEAISFLYYYDMLNSYLFRGDNYRTFFYYNLSFFKLATLIAISNGITDYTYAPPWLTQSIGDGRTKSLKEISTGMFPAQMVSNKAKMFDLFMDVVRSSPELFTGISDDAIRMALYFRNKYAGFWRLQDLHHTGYVKGRLLYRSARLDTQPVEDLLNWIKSTGLKTIVDLRNDSELVRHGYSKDIVDSVRYIRAPVFPDAEKANNEELQSEEEKMNRLYLGTLELESFRKAVKNVFSLLSDSGNLPLLIHCNAGVDRTGMIVAVILSALGIDREIIRYDYEVASGLRKGEYIEKFLDSMAARGGVETLLDEAGIGYSVLEKVRQDLLIVGKSNGNKS